MRGYPVSQLVRLPRGVTLADLVPAQHGDVRQVAANARAMRRVAAGLPACNLDGDDCPVHNKHEATSPGRDVASTDLHSGQGVSGGCCRNGKP